MSQANKLSTFEKTPGSTIQGEVIGERSEVLYEARAWADLYLGLAFHNVMGPKPTDQTGNSLMTSAPEAIPKIVPVIPADQNSAVMAARHNVEDSYRNA